MIWIFVLAVPTLVNFFLMYFFCYETPQFLIKKGPKYTIKIMNKIGKINNGLDNIMTEQDVELVMTEQMT